jgi:membrane dipeptidase
MHNTYKALASGLLMAGALFSAGISGDDVADRAKKIHFSSIVLDTHDDTPQRMLFEHFDLGHRDSEGQIDIPRMREGGLSAIFFSIWTPATMTEPAAEKRAFALIDAVLDQVRKHPQDLALAKTAADVQRIHAGGKIAVLMGVEGGHMINNDLAVLDKFASRGVRYMTLTHTLDTSWAGSSGDDAKHIGLNDFGKSVVQEMNLQGMMVDISHVSDQTFWDALAVSKAPMIASHSSCRALCDAPRNMTDDMIKALAAKGGVIQINYHIGFLSQAYRDASSKSAELKERIAAVDKAAGENEAQSVREGEKVTHQLIAEGKLPQVDWEAIVDHIDHAVKLVGADHVGLGSDFDGSVMPHGMEDCTKLPKLTEAMLRRGYSEEDIRKILGGNTLRVMAEVEKVSHDMQALAERKANKTLGKSK